jgi:hypothetical protein
MKRFGLHTMLTCLAVLATTIGCGDPPAPPVDVDAQAKAKVEAMKQVADAMAKDPNGLDARAALENYRLQIIDVKKNPKEAEELVQVFRQRIKGKYSGEVAQEISMDAQAIESALKTAK